MYCVIQEVERKRKNQNGYPKELKSEYMRMSIQGQDESHYWHTVRSALRETSRKHTGSRFMKATGKMGK